MKKFLKSLVHAKNPFLKLIILFFLLIFGISLVIKYNQSMITPTITDINDLNEFFGNIEIQDSMDILHIQNRVIETIDHEFIGLGELEVKKILALRAGYCYDRSFVLQKIFVYNNIAIRPVFIFYNKDRETSIFHLFSNELLSHNVFEFKYKGKWFVMRTNTPMDKFETLESYISESGMVPSHSKFVRYLNNRNSAFLELSWLPDIYFSNAKNAQF